MSTLPVINLRASLLTTCKTLLPSGLMTTYPNPFFHLKMSTNHWLYRPPGAGNYRSSISCIARPIATVAEAINGRQGSVSGHVQRKVASRSDTVLSQTFICLSPSYFSFSSSLSLFSLSSLTHCSLFFLLSLRLGAKSLHSSQESLQKPGWNLRLLDESERVPLCPSASGALSKFSNCCWLPRGGRARGRVCFCEWCRKAEKKRTVEMRHGMMKPSCVWAPLLLLPLTSLVS